MLVKIHTVAKKFKHYTITIPQETEGLCTTKHLTAKIK